MKTNIRRYLLISFSVVLALAAVVGISLALGQSTSVLAQEPVASNTTPLALNPQAEMPALPLETCTFDGVVRTCDVYATTGTVTLPMSTTVPIWGFSEAAGVPAALPGPVLVANQGETLQVVLHNDLAGEMVSLHFPGFEGIIPDLVGVAAGGMTTYTLDLTNPGTFQFTAGMTENGPRQVAMGMTGILIVRPAGAPNSAYGAAAAEDTTFTREALLVLHEIDPDFNADPLNFDMIEFSPSYWLINGKAYPDADWVGAIPGDTVLMRYVNAGLEQHTFGILGNSQRLIAYDAVPVPFQTTVTADLIDPGQTFDTIVTVPLEAVIDTTYPVFESSLMGHNDSAMVAGIYDFGGMLTFINVNSTLPLPPAGPLVTEFTALNDLGDWDTNDQHPLYIHAVFSETVETVRMFSDPAGLAGVEISETLGASVYDLELSTSTLSLWRDVVLNSGQGSHVKLYIQGMAGGTWGPLRSALVNFDIIGPEVYGLSLKPNPTNGSKDVILNGTADERYTGFDVVESAEFSLDGGGTWSPLELNYTEHFVVAIKGTIPAAAVAALPEGLLPVQVRSTDGHMNVSASSTVTLTVDKTAPSTDAVSLSPNVLDLGEMLTYTHVRLEATVSDAVVNGAGSKVVKVLGFFDGDDIGFELFPSDGKFDEPLESAYFNIPLINFLMVEPGTHQISVEVVGIDEAGNQAAVGGTASVTVIKPEVDLMGPANISVTVSPNPSAGARDVLLEATFADPSGVADVQWYVGNQPAWGQGEPMSSVTSAFGDPSVDAAASIRVNNWRPDIYTLYVAARDMVGNWSQWYPVELTVTRNNQTFLQSSDFSNGFADWEETVGDVRIVPEAQMPPLLGTTETGAGMETIVNGNFPAYAVLKLPTGEKSFSASFYFDPNSIKMTDETIQILLGLDGTDFIYGIELAKGSGYQLRAWAQSSTGLVATAWHPIADDMHKLDLVWRASGAELLKFTVDDTAFTETLEGVAVSGKSLTRVWLGSSLGMSAATSGSMYFDSVTAVRVDFNYYLPALTR